MRPVRKQGGLMAGTDWDALIVCDALRADVAAELAGDVGLPEPETVSSPAGNTTSWWACAAGAAVAARHPLIATANPVVARECAKHADWRQPEPIYERCAGRHTAERVPSVHPQAVNGYVACLLEHPASASPLVAWYVQPHAPYIGAEPLALSRHGKGFDGDHLNRDIAQRCTHPRDWTPDWERLRRAYRENARLALEAAAQLAGMLHADGRGLVVITSDHGELLGEGGRFAHQWDWNAEPLLRQVPWWELRRDETANTDRINMLEALGYA